MDSLSQIGLGAAVAIATLGRRTAVWKAALWGAVAGTLADLDVLIDHGDPIRNMVLHRAETHALFWLTLAALPLAAACAGRAAAAAALTPSAQRRVSTIASCLPFGAQAGALLLPLNPASSLRWLVYNDCTYTTA